MKYFGWLRPLADPLRQLDDDSLRAADIAEPIHVVVVHYLANELRATFLEARDDGVDSSTANETWRAPGVFAGACSSPPCPGGL
jgi:hypothetical protein